MRVYKMADLLGAAHDFCYYREYGNWDQLNPELEEIGFQDIGEPISEEDRQALLAKAEEAEAAAKLVEEELVAPPKRLQAGGLRR